MSRLNQLSSKTNREGIPGPAPSCAPAPLSVSPDQVRLRAYEIYQTRTAKGERGDEASDWRHAEQALNGFLSKPMAFEDVAVKAKVRGAAQPAGSACSL